MSKQISASLTARAQDASTLNTRSCFSRLANSLLRIGRIILFLEQRNPRALTQDKIDTAEDRGEHAAKTLPQTRQSEPLSIPERKGSCLQRTSIHRAGQVSPRLFFQLTSRVRSPVRDAHSGALNRCSFTVTTRCNHGVAAPLLLAQRTLLGQRLKASRSPLSQQCELEIAAGRGVCQLASPPAVRATDPC